jgi:hypothetical protein
MSDMAGKAATGSGRAERERARYNGADGISDPPSPTLRRGRHSNTSRSGIAREDGNAVRVASASTGQCE